jgi:hypothetical protein
MGRAKEDDAGRRAGSRSCSMTGGHIRANHRSPDWRDRETSPLCTFGAKFPMIYVSPRPVYA